MNPPLFTQVPRIGVLGSSGRGEFIRKSSLHVIVATMAEGKKPRTEIHAPKPAARNPRWTTVVLLVGIVISIGVAIAVGYLFDSQLVIRILRVIAIILAVACFVAFLYRLIRLGYRYEWTGFGEADLPNPENREVRPEKTVWDWMQLLIVPVVLAIITVVFTLYQEGRQSRIEQQRAQNALQVAEERAQAAELQDYLDQMGSLLLNKDRPLRQSKEEDEVRTLARARTLTILERMNPSRKRQVIQFLYEADLIRGVEGSQPIISLREVNLSDANLFQVKLSDAFLSRANLEKAALWQSDLSGAHLSGANLTNADLRGAYLGGAGLSDANLSNANLNDAQMATGKELEDMAKTLEGATMPDGSKHP
jgi:hypothetical protein